MAHSIIGTLLLRAWDSDVSKRITVASLVSSTAVNTIIGLFGLAVPAAAYVAKHTAVTETLLIVAAVVIIALVLKDQWLKERQITTPLGDPSKMADAKFFKEIQRNVVARTIAQMEDFSDGYLRVFASEVPNISILLFRTLANGESDNKLVQATDLTRDPAVLMTRRDYLGVNRLLIRSGGSVQRIFICKIEHLTSQQFAADLLKLVDQHRSIGVICGLAIWDSLTAHQAVDFVVFARSAVLVEDEQGDKDYQNGRSTVQFKRIDAWRDVFQTLWESNETASAGERLALYEKVVRHQLLIDEWAGDTVRESIYSTIGHAAID